MPAILVIDDSPTVVAVARRALGRDGHEVLTLNNFAELPSVLRRSPPDLILLDLNMPIISGATFGDFIRRMGGERIPIVLYSSAPQQELDEVARKIGAAATLAKSENDERLCSVVRRVLHG